MITALRWTIAMALIAWSTLASAGNIYVCRGTNGVNSYQNTPCASLASQLGHNTYNDAMAAPAVRQPEPPPTDIPDMQPQATQPTAQQYARQPVPQQPSAYQCTAGRRTWIQTTPCPASYMTGTVMNIEGQMVTGEHVTGTGFMPTQQPIRQTELDNEELCAQVRAGARLAGGGSSASQSYERNKIKRDQCGG